MIVKILSDHGFHVNNKETKRKKPEEDNNAMTRFLFYSSLNSEPRFTIK